MYHVRASYNAACCLVNALSQWHKPSFRLVDIADSDMSEYKRYARILGKNNVQFRYVKMLNTHSRVFDTNETIKTLSMYILRIHEELQKGGKL